ncbi:glycosyltransferase family 2 protein [Qipengyuania spongiae]|uniref:Glycosyltransferase family 2 protein n=1 Tax=Qipengyuania spongiae TaxID=2909673 RepID=A0ABY5T6D5_9SPHN|nr:glycosyltransferase family 2 protein [Qipengyuania spongiae]UVI40878.1 glycosyltransferase family 2 protein [Qipengyuania spongiae]
MNGEAVDIVIVNWNAGPLLAACLRSIASSNTHRISSIVVIDNASSDGSADINCVDLPLEIVKSEVNLGFGRACNLGAEQGNARYLLFLNPDTEVGPSTITTAVEFLDRPEHSDIGVLGIRLEDRDGTIQRHCARFPSWRTMVGEALGLSHFFPEQFPPVIMREFDHRTERDVDHVIGAFYCMRRDLFERVGGFDPTYFVYFEDLDLSHRIAQTGARIHYEPHITAYHKGGGTSDQIKARRLCYALAGRLTYADKHFSRLARAAVYAAILLVEPLVRTVRALISSSRQELCETWQGFGMLYKSLLSRRRARLPDRP